MWRQPVMEMLVCVLSLLYSFPECTSTHCFFNVEYLEKQKPDVASCQGRGVLSTLNLEKYIFSLPTTGVLLGLCISSELGPSWLGSSQ